MKYTGLLCAIICLVTSCQTVVIQPRPRATRQSTRPFRGFAVDPVFGSRIFIYEVGRHHDETVILVHGLDNRASGVWENQVAALAEEYHVIVLDLPGFGRSDKGNELYSPTNYAHVLKALVDRRVEGEFALVGHGLGGLIALRYAALYPRDLDRLVLIDVMGVLHRKALARYIAGTQATGTFPSAVAVPDPEDKARAALATRARREEAFGGEPRRIAAAALLREDIGPALPSIKAPALILWGAEDAVAPKRVAKLLSAHLPNARFKVMPRVGHVPMLEAPEPFNKLLFDYLGEMVPAPPFAVSTEGPATKMLECSNREDVTFSGDYRSIVITDSKNIRLLNVTAESITLTRSSVILENSRIVGKGTALKTSSSVAEITGVDLFGKTAIDSSASVLDLAGVRLRGSVTAIYTDTRSELLFSASRADSPALTGRLHGPYKPPPAE